MRLILFTRPDIFEGEAAVITAIMERGLETLHLRKPDTADERIERLICAIPTRFHSRIVLHGAFHLAERYGLRGIHLNSRSPLPPQGYKGQISRTCHSLDEVARFKDECDYVTLSPIFDSISKRGYAAAFTREQIDGARRAGLIDKSVIALGGIDESNIAAVHGMGFGGAALLGAVWNTPAPVEAFMRCLRAANEADGTARHPVAVLSIAGSDPSGGAGIQADIKAITALGAYAATAITAVTVQNTLGVRSVFPLPPQVVADQIDAVMEDIEPQAVKIGMVNDAEIVRAIAAAIRRHSPRWVVYDPVMVSTSGHRLIEAETTEIIERELMPSATLVTPNMSEAEVLWHRNITSVADMEASARDLAARYGTAVLVKGGHLAEGPMCDVLCSDGRIEMFSGERIATRNLHGTGCTLSSAIATLLAQGMPLAAAVAEAKRYVTAAIRAGIRMHIGHGNGPLWHMAGR